MSAMPRSLQRTLVGVVLAHAGLLWWMVQRDEGGASRLVLPALLTRWIAPPVVATPIPPAPNPPIVARRPRAATPSVAAPVDAAPMAGSPGAAQEPAPTPAPAATAEPVSEPALRADSVQRAAREAARRKGLAELSDERLGQQPVDAQAGLRNGMASAARGDCLKGGEGGYKGAGLGLLALPLLAFDAATGRCR